MKNRKFIRRLLALAILLVLCFGAQTLLPELLEYETDGTEREALRAARHAKGDCP